MSRVEFPEKYSKLFIVNIYSSALNLDIVEFWNRVLRLYLITFHKLSFVTIEFQNEFTIYGIEPSSFLQYITYGLENKTLSVILSQGFSFWNKPQNSIYYYLPLLQEIIELFNIYTVKILSSDELLFKKCTAYEAHYSYVSGENVNELSFAFTFLTSDQYETMTLQHYFSELSEYFLKLAVIDKLFHDFLSSFLLKSENLNDMLMLLLKNNIVTATDDYSVVKIVLPAKFYEYFPSRKLKYLKSQKCSSDLNDFVSFNPNIPQYSEEFVASSMSSLTEKDIATSKITDIEVFRIRNAANMNSLEHERVELDYLYNKLTESAVILKRQKEYSKLLNVLKRRRLVQRKRVIIQNSLLALETTKLRLDNEILNSQMIELLAVETRLFKKLRLIPLDESGTDAAVLSQNQPHSSLSWIGMLWTYLSGNEVDGATLREITAVDYEVLLLESAEAAEEIEQIISKLRPIL